MVRNYNLNIQYIHLYKNRKIRGKIQIKALTHDKMETNINTPIFGILLLKSLIQMKELKKLSMSQMKENILMILLFFIKKQEIYIKLYNDLNTFWEVLDNERVQFQLDTASTYYIPYTYLSYEEFSKLHNIINNFYNSQDFLYMPQEIQNIIITFL